MIAYIVVYVMIVDMRIQVMITYTKKTQVIIADIRVQVIITDFSMQI